MASNSNFLDFIFPTKNRWHLLEKSLDSFLSQTNHDFNVLIVDNSDTPQQLDLAQSVLKKYNNHLSIKYHRTGGLNMLENWNKGYELSDAQYCYLVTDKIILDPNAVELFRQGATTYPDCNIFLFSITGEQLWQKKITTDLIAQTLDKMDNFYNACWGSELKPFLKREYKNQLITKYHKLIHFIGGDVDVVYLALMNEDAYAVYNFNLIANRNNTVGSVGRSGEYGGALYRKYIQEIHLDYNNLYPEAPINIPNNFNGMYNDLFATAKLCNYPCTKEQINKINYIIDLYISLLRFSRIYSISNDKYFLMLHNYIEENNLQFHPEINRCFWYYAQNYTLEDYRIPINPPTHKRHKLSRIGEFIFSSKRENGSKIIRLFGFPIYSKIKEQK